MFSEPPARLRLALPKGRMLQGVRLLLADAGIALTCGERDYRPRVSWNGCEVKLLKPQNVVEMLHAGSRDVGFTGADWVAELEADLVELVDTGLDPVRVVAAAPATIAKAGLPDHTLVVASEYETLTRRWIEDRPLKARFLRSYGATEVFPPEDADIIVDNTATGATLRANGLAVLDTLMASSTRLYANPRALEEADKRETIEALALVVRAALEARQRVMVEVNVDPSRLEELLAVVPCMRRPTVSPLSGGEGFAVKAAVPRDQLPTVIPALKAQGGTDVVVSRLEQIVP